jgi:hypothetical protein
VKYLRRSIGEKTTKTAPQVMSKIEVRFGGQSIVIAP